MKEITTQAVCHRQTPKKSTMSHKVPRERNVGNSKNGSDILHICFYKPFPTYPWGLSVHVQVHG